MSTNGVASMSTEPASQQHFLSPIVASIRKRFQSLASRACAICAAFALLLSLLICFRVAPFYELLSDTELKLQDALLVWRDTFAPPLERKVAKDIVLVSAGSESARRLSLAENQPWPRTVYGALLKTLREAG